MACIARRCRVRGAGLGVRLKNKSVPVRLAQGLRARHMHALVSVCQPGTHVYRHIL
jgi:hypothetical protein